MRRYFNAVVDQAIEDLYYCYDNCLSGSCYSAAGRYGHNYDNC